MKLHVPIKIWQRIQYYTQLSLPHEITGIGTINIIDTENLEVTEIFLPRQTANTCSCDLKPGIVICGVDSMQSGGR